MKKAEYSGLKFGYKVKDLIKALGKMPQEAYVVVNVDAPIDEEEPQLLTYIEKGAVLRFGDHKPSYNCFIKKPIHKTAMAVARYKGNKLGNREFILLGGQAELTVKDIDK